MLIQFLQALLALSGSLAKMMEQKGLLDAGAAQAILRGVRDADDAINRAKRARANANSVPVDEDPFNRNNRS